jgi:hypothetical protein
MVEMVLSEDFDKRSARVHFSRKRVTKATPFSASTSSTSHITIIGLNIVDPFGTSIAFLSKYLRPLCSIPRCKEFRRLERKGKPNAYLMVLRFAARRSCRICF